MTTQRINFTKRSIEALPGAPKGKRDFYQDTRLKALRLEVTDTGKKTYKVYRKMHGRPVRYTIGDIQDWSIEKAREKAEEISSLISKGTNPNIEKKRIRQEITFGKLFSEYMERYSKKHKRTWKQDEWEFKKFLSHWSNRKISSLNRDEIQRLHDKIGSRNGPYQANRILDRIRVIYNKAIEWGWEGANPAKGIKGFKEQSRDRFLKPSELPFFFEALNEEKNKTACDYILMSLYTGARKSNVLAMRWAEIDFQQFEWRIPETKNGEPLTIALSQEAVDILKRRRQKANSNLTPSSDAARSHSAALNKASQKWVFPSDRCEDHFTDPKHPWKRILTNATIKFWQGQAPLTPLVTEAMRQAHTTKHDQALYAAVQALARQKNIDLPTGLIDVRLHDLRRTLGSFQAAAGASAYIIGKSLGHKSQQATAIYARLDLDPVRASVQLASSAINSAGKIKKDGATAINPDKPMA